uniref:Zinc finger CCCH domain-containing protein 14 n=1 Tax=Steinernema glaseri TaxID=37863 RepID=A0A1I8A9Q0_9BILA
MESEEEPMQSNDSPATPASSPPRSVSPASEARALALASLRRPIAPPSTEDIPLPPSVENNQPEEPSHQDEEVLPPPPPPPELDTHDMDNSAVVDMDVDVEEEPVQKSTPTENARRIPTIGSTSTNQVNLLTQLRSNNINISLDPPPPPPKLTEQEQLMADIREVTKRRVMTGSVHQDELSPNCIRPQQALGRTFPLKVRVVVEEEGDHSDSNNYNQENYRPKVAALRKVASESQVTDSGRNEPKFLPPWAVRRLELSAQPAQPALPLCFGNRTMRVINGKRIYSDSNTCYEFAEKGTCTAGIFCRFGHGEQEPTERKICAKMLRGQCRGDRGCPLNHDLPPHQVPICDFYMRYSCNHASCCFLHVKHSEDKPPCEDFNKGTCSNGDACSKPHRYIYRTVKQRGEFPSFPANGVAAQQ